ncbi:MAG: glycoside hydrolase family 25 protein [Ruminococcus sp.]|nr:glycoside hydrolase family 25 protein [Ruminococcus sp.]
MAVSGIDVSKWQGRIDWQKVKNAGVGFALLRAGYGDALSYPAQIDETFEYNYSQCKKVSMPVGAYWYSYATTEAMAVQEAKSCIAALKGKQFEYPIYYDVEEMRIFQTGRTNEIIKAFCDEMEKAGYWAGIYIFRSAVQTYLSQRTRSRYAMAIAEYGSKLNYSGQYGIWQNSSTWRVDGINGNVDHDWCYIDYPKQIKERGKNGFPKPADTSFRVEAKSECDTFKGKESPPIAAHYKSGDRCTVEYTKDFYSQTWGKVKGADMWVRMSDFKRV